MTLLFTDPAFLAHRTGMHPERPQRLTAILTHLASRGLDQRCTAAQASEARIAEVTSLHAPEQVEAAREACAAGGGYLDADTPVSPESFSVALKAVGASRAAVDAVLDGQDTTALCLVRPPGHHATARQSMGFCLFNNVALAAQRALERGASRVLVLDWDVHHGNGTQDIFYADGRVTFLSIHRYGHGFYPGTGAKRETGTGPGLGHTFNVPLPFGTSRKQFQSAFTASMDDAARASHPEVVLLSAGFDAHVLDPIGSLGLETEDYEWMTALVRDVANTHAGGRLISCLEGGYHLEALAESVGAHLSGLLNPRA
jgi:acetoin utilization deacetylase AcuC-like enzyme